VVIYNFNIRGYKKSPSEHGQAEVVVKTWSKLERLLLQVYNALKKEQEKNLT
jgi:hypothetical protein